MVFLNCMLRNWWVGSVLCVVIVVLIVCVIFVFYCVLMVSGLGLFVYSCYSVCVMFVIDGIVCVGLWCVSMICVCGNMWYSMLSVCRCCGVFSSQCLVGVMLCCVFCYCRNCSICFRYVQIGVRFCCVSQVVQCGMFVYEFIVYMNECFISMNFLLVSIVLSGWIVRICGMQLIIVVILVCVCVMCMVGVLSVLLVSGVGQCVFYYVVE